ncbi:MAG: hypothetical protein AB7P22_16950 [Vicinamibacterales bacterium]
MTRLTEHATASLRRAQSQLRRHDITAVQTPAQLDAHAVFVRGIEVEATIVTWIIVALSLLATLASVYVFESTITSAAAGMMTWAVMLLVIRKSGYDERLRLWPRSHATIISDSVAVQNLERLSEMQREALKAAAAADDFAAAVVVEWIESGHPLHHRDAMALNRFLMAVEEHAQAMSAADRLAQAAARGRLANPSFFLPDAPR